MRPSVKGEQAYLCVCLARIDGKPGTGMCSQRGDLGLVSKLAPGVRLDLRAQGKDWHDLWGWGIKVLKRASFNVVLLLREEAAAR